MVESHNVTIKNINKFDIRDEIYTDSFQIFKNWIRNGEIICGESISYDIKYSLLYLEETNYLILENYNSNLNVKFLEDRLEIDIWIYLRRGKIIDL